MCVCHATRPDHSRRYGARTVVRIGQMPGVRVFEVCALPASHTVAGTHAGRGLDG